MYPVFFEGATEIKKPVDMTDEQCTSIWAKYGFQTLLTMFANGISQLPPGTLAGVDEEGFTYFVTAWMPNKEDREAINRGEAIFIKTVSNGLPPMALFTIDPVEEPAITDEWLLSRGFMRLEDEPYRIDREIPDTVHYAKVYSIQVGNTLYLQWIISENGVQGATLCPETWPGSGFTLFHDINTRSQLANLYFMLSGEALKSR